MDERGRETRLAGVLHLHTTYSDGEFSLPELKRALVGDGCRFAAVTDHAEAFDTVKIAAYREECAALSDDRFLFIPGLEFACEGKVHILGYGCTVLIDTRDPARVCSHIGEQGGVSVLAHPLEEHLTLVEPGGAPFQGLEAWNSKYDGRYAPRVSLFDRVARLRDDGREVVAFFGLDLHWKTQFRGLRTLVRAGSLEPQSLLNAFRAGAFTGSFEGVELPADGRLDGSLRRRFAERHQRADRVRRFLKGAKRLAARLGVRVPAAVKNQLRRIL